MKDAINTKIIVELVTKYTCKVKINPIGEYMY